MNYYIIAGEASGDLHGSNLIHALRRHDPDAVIRCWGGDKMQAAGGTLVKHYRELAFMGFSEVIMNLRTIFRNLAFCKEDILQHKPDTIVLIDYPGFNLRIAKWAKEQNIKVVYYISPQVWAWKAGRVKMMKECIDKMLVILPFEKDYFKDKWGWEVEYVGHPLLEAVGEVKLRAASSELRDGNRIVALLPGNRKPTSAKATADEARIVALLPGSRKQEILKKLPVMLEVSKYFPDHQFIVAGAPGMDPAFYAPLMAPYPNVSLLQNQTYDLLSKADAALVTSGTATLETALFGVPEVVCYKASWLSYQIGKRVVDIKYICLANLIMDRLVVKEMIQDDMTTENLRKELELLLHDETYRNRIKADYAALRELLHQGGDASEKAALSIVKFLAQ